MKVKIKKLSDKGIIPKYSNPGDAGMDLTATWIDISNDQYIEYGTDIAIEIPKGYCGLIFPRSSNSKTDLLLCNSVGIIDHGYLGEIKFRFKRVPNRLTPSNSKSIPIVEYKVGDRIGQLIIMPYPNIEFEEVETLSESIRGDGGFGSSGL